MHNFNKCRVHSLLFFFFFKVTFTYSLSHRGQLLSTPAVYCDHQCILGTYSTAEECSTFCSGALQHYEPRFLSPT